MEKKRLTSLFEKLYNGDPWIDVNIVTVLGNLSASQASTRIFPNTNTIWEITNHLISWRLNVLKRIQGEVIVTPNNNYVEEVMDTSREAWTDTLSRLEQTQLKWLGFLNELNMDTLTSVYPPNGMTYYEHIQGIIQHDAYHLGQIVMLSKQF